MRVGAQVLFVTNTAKRKAHFQWKKSHTKFITVEMRISFVMFSLMLALSKRGSLKKVVRVVVNWKACSKSRFSVGGEVQSEIVRRNRIEFSAIPQTSAPHRRNHIVKAFPGHQAFLLSHPFLDVDSNSTMQTIPETWYFSSDENIPKIDSWKMIFPLRVCL